jgi:hypothetical protein
VAVRCRRANRLPNGLRLRRRYRVVDVRRQHGWLELLTVPVRYLHARPRWHPAWCFRAVKLRGLEAKLHRVG